MNTLKMFWHHIKLNPVHGGYTWTMATMCDHSQKEHMGLLSYTINRP